MLLIVVLGGLKLNSILSKDNAIIVCVVVIFGQILNFDEIYLPMI